MLQKSSTFIKPILSQVVTETITTGGSPPAEPFSQAALSKGNFS